jgi:hypothetical protein
MTRYHDGTEKTVLPAIASAMLLLSLAAAAIWYMKSYHPTQAPVVERARAPHGVRAKVRGDARQWLRPHQRRRAGLNQTEPEASHQELAPALPGRHRR